MIDVEALAVTWLTAAFPSHRVSTETSDKLQENLPWHRVTRTGGGDRDFRIDSALITIDTFGSIRILAREAAEAVRSSIIIDLPGKTVGPGSVRGTDTIHAPIWVPWDDTNIRRFVATYQLIVTPF